MSERPILFSAPMVRAILDGRKTVTRRVIKPEWWRCLDPESPDDRARAAEQSPYGVRGDRLWVREAWRTSAKLDARNGTEIAKECLDAGYHRPWAPIEYGADGERRDWDGPEWGKPGRARSARFMPRWASRLTLDVVSVRVERVQEMDEGEAVAEGFMFLGVGDDWKRPDAFRPAWDAMHAARGFGWDANPWVFRVEFRRAAS